LGQWTKKTKRVLPNILSLSRLGCAPFLVVLASHDSRTWFTVILGGALLTDVLDGFLARHWRVTSERGRILDSCADYVLVLAAVAGISFLWTEIVKQEWLWITAALAAYSITPVYGLLRWRIVFGYHTWGSKALASVFIVTGAILFTGGSALPFRVAVCCQVLEMLEQLVIAFLLPGHSGNVPTLWHAWRIKMGR
jgi:phosphatidylglycerophosphate synthase